MTKLLDFINPYLGAIKLGLIVATVLGAAMGGWTARGWKEDAARLDAERAAAEEYRKTVEGWSAALAEISRQDAEHQQQAAADRRTWRKEMDDARRNGRGLVVCGGGLQAPGLGRENRPGDAPARLSAEFVRVFNLGLDIGLPAADRAWRPDGRPTGAGLSAGR